MDHRGWQELRNHAYKIGLGIGKVAEGLFPKIRLFTFYQAARHHSGLRLHGSVGACCGSGLVGLLFDYLLVEVLGYLNILGLLELSKGCHRGILHDSFLGPAVTRTFVVH